MHEPNNDLILTYPTNEPNSNLISITQIAKMLNISRDSLIRYEKENLLTPIRKGIRGDRFYDNDHVAIIEAIRKEKKKQYKRNALHMVKTRREQIANRKRQLTK